ncbi:MAG TPA: G5 domain-containing protein [Anaerolineales bacterium]|nr:G5 domain-containing protein [Anaerolineales bacterium]
MTRATKALLLASLIVLAACSGPAATAGALRVIVEVDGSTLEASVPAGSSVQEAVEASGVELGELDRLTPPAYTVVTDGTTIQVTRVEERFEVESNVVPFERQTVRNEALPQGETRLLQAGQNGLEEVTYRIVVEEGLEVSRTPVKREVVQPSQPEIVMIGVEAAYSPVPIEGVVAYVSGGNVWVVSGNSGSRQPIVLSGDADGRILRLSPDGRWVLFTRRGAEGTDDINTLWVTSTIQVDFEPFSLRAPNVVHFADWSPDSTPLKVAFSTVEPRPAAPGWQANNDLILVTISIGSGTGRVSARETIVPANAGGQYGWWGTSYAWSDDGDRLAFARADGVGVIDLDAPDLEPALPQVPYQTLGDWAWVPGVAWGHDARTLFTVRHGAPVGLESEAASPIFDVVAIQPSAGLLLTMQERTGMFAYPSVSPVSEGAEGELEYQVAFLQALTPLESRDSHYQVVILDRDGSNRRTVYPAAGEPGLEPQRVAWSPGADRLALIYRGDVYVVDLGSGLGHRLTSDGQATIVDWKP